MHSIYCFRGGLPPLMLQCRQKTGETSVKKHFPMKRGMLGMEQGVAYRPHPYIFVSHSSFSSKPFTDGVCNCQLFPSGNPYLLLCFGEIFYTLRSVCIEIRSLVSSHIALLRMVKRTCPVSSLTVYKCQPINDTSTNRASYLLQ